MVLGIQPAVTVRHGSLGHMVSTVRKQKEMDAGVLLAFPVSLSPPRHTQGGSSYLSSTNPEAPSQIFPEACLLNIDLHTAIGARSLVDTASCGMSGRLHHSPSKTVSLAHFCLLPLLDPSSFKPSYNISNKS